MLMLYSEELIKANPYIRYPIRVSQPTGMPVKSCIKLNEANQELSSVIGVHHI